MSTDALIQAAVQIRARAYAPYSKFFVGAALRADDGSIFACCNVENAAYPQGVCAEGGAISMMIAAGHTAIAEVVVAGPKGMACTPCGGCRQKLREFAGPTCVITMVDADGDVVLSRTLAELLPDSFGPDHLA